MPKLDITISLIFFIISKELNELAVATPKCLTLKLPHLSSSVGFPLTPSTMIEVTAVPCW